MVSSSHCQWRLRQTEESLLDLQKIWITKENKRENFVEWTFQEYWLLQVMWTRILTHASRFLALDRLQPTASPPKAFDWPIHCPRVRFQLLESGSWELFPVVCWAMIAQCLDRIPLHANGYNIQWQIGSHWLLCNNFIVISTSVWYLFAPEDLSSESISSSSSSSNLSTEKNGCLGCTNGR